MGQLGSESAKKDGDTIKQAVESVVEALAETTPDSSRKEIARRVVTYVASSVTGAGVSVGTITPMFSGLDPRWAAIFGAVLGAAANLFTNWLTDDPE